MKTANRFLTAFAVFFLYTSCQKSEMQDLKSQASKAESSETRQSSIDKKNLAIGNLYGGGIIVYLDETGNHGLIAALQDVGPAPWGCDGTLIPYIDYSLSGEEHTRQILAYCNEPGIAARLCDELVVREKGDKGKKYDDWFMPNSNEFYRILTAANSLDDMNFTNSISLGGYWLPYQWFGTFQAFPVDPSTNAHYVIMTSYGTPPDLNVIAFTQMPLSKTSTLRVRPVRRF